MEEDHDELRFVCKLCDKRYPSGKSLGGHMRSHVIAAAAAANSSESDEKFSTLMLDGNPSAYGLRENPKKTWRAVGSSTFTYPNERICKQCGKGFQSLKALCGHMACHSEKDRNFKDYDHSWTSENLDQDDKVIIDSYSDTEEPEFDHDPDQNPDQDPTRVTRSKSKRYKKVVIKPYSFNFSLTNSYNNNYYNNTSNNSHYNYESSSVSETDELEQEEVALCLMMLSKDSANWAGFNSIVESSDNNSAVFETKSSSVEMRISNNESYSGWNHATRKVESDISVEDLLRNGDPSKKPKRVFDKTREELTYEQKLEIRRNLFKEFAYRGSLKKRARDDDDVYTPELERDVTNKKRNKYECLTCNKVFTSFQGLGGHRPCYKRNTYNNVGSKNESGENSFEGEYGHIRKAKYDKKPKAKKNKGHECPICFRMFKSGQALGGHKRSHFINGSIDHFAAMGHGAPSYSDMIDLNLPAPEEE